MAKTTKKTKKVKPKEEAIPVEIVEEAIVEEKPVEKKALPKKIKVLMCLANPTHTYEPGNSYEVGKDISEETAENWLRNNVAVEDKSSEGAEETK